MTIAASRTDIPLIFTGPFPALMNSSAHRRRNALMGAGWNPGTGVRYVWPTASATWDGAGKRIWIAVDDQTDPSDWAQVLAVLRMAGWLIGLTGYTDIGEPGWDRANRVWLWVLPCP